MADWQKPSQSFSLLGTGKGAVLGFAVGMSSDCERSAIVKNMLGEKLGKRRKQTYIRADGGSGIVARVSAR